MTLQCQSCSQATTTLFALVLRRILFVCHISVILEAGVSAKHFATVMASHFPVMLTARCFGGSAFCLKMNPQNRASSVSVTTHVALICPLEPISELLLAEWHKASEPMCVQFTQVYKLGPALRTVQVTGFFGSTVSN